MLEDVRMAGWLDEEKAAMDAGILNVSFSLRSKFLAQVGRMLVLDIFHDWIPAVLHPPHRQSQRQDKIEEAGKKARTGNITPSVIVHKVTVARGIDNVEP